MSSFRSRRALVAGFALALVAAGCASTGAAPTVAPGATAGSGSGTVTVTSASSATLGAYLVGPTGLTLYTKTSDTANTSTCTGGCAASWPPLALAAGQQIVAGAGVTGTLASFARADGSMQVTYNGLPLYYWVQDTKAGDTTGQGVGGFIVAAAAGAGGGAVSPGAASPLPTKGGY